MKSTIFAVIAMVVCCCSFPIFAQQPDTQEVMNAAKALGAQESKMFANWFRMLKRDGGSWKIAVEGFARAGAIDAPAASASTK